MRVLFITGGGTGPLHALAPFAMATRSEGHEVIVAAPDDHVQQLVDVGLPAVGVSKLGLFDAMFIDRNGNRLDRPLGPEAELEFASRGFARMAADAYGAISELARAWRPDIVVGGTRNYAAALIGNQLKIPYVCQAWDGIERVPSDLVYASDELSPELTELGLDRIPKEDLFVAITPPSVRPADAEPAQYMRWLPGNRQMALEPWMYTKGDKRRVLITSGSRAAMIPDLGVNFFKPLLENPVFADVELIIPTPEKVAEQLRELRPGLHTGFFPLDIIVPTCDLMVHHGGGVTSATASNAGVPQLVLADMIASADPTRRIDAYGASITLLLKDATPDDVAQAAQKMLSDPSYSVRARALQQEIANLPRPSDVVKVMEDLVAANR
ncbi:nucleotide disphospho-sugar-binding domain-containing protein [Lentzea nigeriaca]|uniref:nucleotide disphospho-sugar-binding domain-containing protein n=1 Tax=Lentzea nigeriaca TaxID=1128665 RepID=UPI00195E9B78|nr:nucleotide disphospho-sugar-binding domain-containing protein [Lentzea nigeriaca]MBM7862197.1 UDP:flavonoid glycosyltransferase YjiC (YdhE family) [Lentzea nigeriaca]